MFFPYHQQSNSFIKNELPSITKLVLWNLISWKWKSWNSLIWYIPITIRLMVKVYRVVISIYNIKFYRMINFLSNSGKFITKFCRTAISFCRIQDYATPLPRLVFISLPSASHLRKARPPQYHGEQFTL